MLKYIWDKGNRLCSTTHEETKCHAQSVAVNRQKT